MTAPVTVDVLAALDALRKEWRNERLIVSRLDSANVLDSLHAAVAELIALGREVEQADHNGATTDELMDRFRAALARCGGAQ